MSSVRPVGPTLSAKMPMAIVMLAVVASFVGSLLVSPPTRAVLVVEVLSVVATLGAGAFAFHTLSRQTRLVAAHNQLLEARANELEAFAGRVAHDLRNPLNALVLRIETLRLRGVNDPDAIEKLATQAKRMDHVIDGMLEFARSGGAPRADAEAELHEVLDGVVVDTRPAIENARAELRVAPFDKVKVACTADALTSVVANLLANAAKYIVDAPTDVRTIDVRVAARSGRVRVEVEDTGPGLPAGAPREIVFEPFRRMAGDRHPGIGLGLATVKKIVEAYRGSCGVASEPGAGCMFWFELPAA